MRARNIKPGFFKNEDVGELPPEGRLLFTGLWCLADREGRLQDRPRQIRGEIFPYEMDIDVEKLLSLMAKKLIIRYEVKGERYIQVKNFIKHQQPHYKELPSAIPPPKGHKDSLYIGGGVSESMRQHIFEKDKRKCVYCGLKSNLTIDHIKPRVLGGSNDEDNLQTLCRKCNSSKNNRIMSQRSSKVDPTLGDLSSLNPDSPSLIPDVLNPESNKDIPAKPDFAGVFESLWLQYPKRLGRKAALRHFNGSVKTEADVLAIRSALANYKKQIEGKEKQYVQHGSTWFNNWRDYVEAEHGSNDSKGFTDFKALARAAREAKNAREKATAGVVSDGPSDTADVQSEDRGSAGGADE